MGIVDQHHLLFRLPIPELKTYSFKRPFQLQHCQWSCTQAYFWILHSYTVARNVPGLVPGLMYLYWVSSIWAGREMNRRQTYEQANKVFDKAMKLEQEFGEYFTGENLDCSWMTGDDIRTHIFCEEKCTGSNHFSPIAVQVLLDLEEGRMGARQGMWGLGAEPHVKWSTPVPVLTKDFKRRRL